VTRTETNIARWTLNGLAAAILVAGLALAVHSHIATDLIVRSGSMAPSIPVGALVTVEPVALKDLAPGMVVTVELDGGVLVTHRLNRMIDLDGRPYLELKGDANSTPDPVLVPATAVIGQARSVIPLLGFALAMLSGLAGQLTLLAVVTLLVACRWLIEDLVAAEHAEPTRVASSPKVATRVAR
jgi:signal peptidase I